MSDCCKYFFLYSKAVHTISVGDDVQQGRYIQKAHIVNNEMKAQLNRKSLKYNWHEADVTVLEGVFARGDRKVSKVILEAL